MQQDQFPSIAYLYLGSKFNSAFSSIIRVLVLKNPSGMCVFSPGPGVKEDRIKVIRQILKAVGEVEKLPEDKQNAVTGLSGSGPAYIYTVIEGLIKGGVKAGLNQKVAYNLAVQTTLGAAKVVKESNLSLEDLLSAVVSPSVWDT